jgi:hypothetical protein
MRLRNACKSTSQQRVIINKQNSTAHDR